MSLKRKPVSIPVETEAKVRVTSFASIRRRAEAAGGRLVTPRTRETNTLFDANDGRLSASGRSFRVRRYGAVGSVTLKGVARVERGLKSRDEIETEVASPEALTQILLSLGYLPQFRYEKFREVWTLRGVVICLDETPVGRFVEIEGSHMGVHRAARALGLAPTEFLTASYPALWAAAGRGGDMVFKSAKLTGSRA